MPAAQLERITWGVSPRGIATLTLARPERGNAFDAVMLAEIAGRIRTMAEDSGLRMLVLRGAGRHFCVGADIGALDAPAGTPAVKLIDLMDALDTLGKPTLAVVQGGCLGGGLALAAACDVLVASGQAFFAIPEARLGFGASPLTPFFVRAVGLRAFRRYGLSGERFDATEALRIGLAHAVCDDSALEPTLARILDEFMQSAPGSIAAFKSAMRVGAPAVSVADRAALEAGFAASRTAAEALEGLAAFREKRKPRWYQ